jgi:hypothetical protein
VKPPQAQPAQASSCAGRLSAGPYRSPTKLPRSAPTCSPWQAASRDPLGVSAMGSRTGRQASGLEVDRPLPADAFSAARRRSPHAPLSPASSLSRAAVTRRAAKGRGRRASATSALTATTTADNRSRSAGRAARLASSDLLTSLDAAPPADLPAAVHALSLASAPRTTASASSLATGGSGGGHHTIQLRLAPPATDSHSCVGLIDQQTRLRGMGSLWPLSTRPAGFLPAGVTQGEEI